MSDSPRELHLQLIGTTSANEFNGARVASDLREHRHLWQAAVLDQSDVDATLVYLSMDVIATGQVWILSTGSDDQALLKLAEGWSASEISWESELVGEEAGRVLHVSWD